MAERLSPQDGRQGERGRSVLWVLVASLVLMAIATVGLLTWNGGNAPRDYASRSQDAARGEVAGSSAGASPSNGAAVLGGNPSYPRPAGPKADAGRPK